MLSVTCNDVVYTEGDTILFKQSSGTKNSITREVKGILRFGVYMDAECWTVFEHLGFYVEVKEGSSITLPDAIASGGKIVNE